MTRGRVVSAEGGALARAVRIDPSRRCSGGPPGPWCGKPATHVARDASGLEWFTCGEGHAHGAVTTPIADWFARLGEPLEEPS